jgi:hypothetical protein
MTTKLVAGQVFSRKRGFRPAEYGRARWWMVGVNEGRLARGFGTEHIAIEEVISSATLGDIAIYRQWCVDPDGNDVENQWTPKKDEVTLRPVSSLRHAMNTMRMQDVTPKRVAPVVLAEAVASLMVH